MDNKIKILLDKIGIDENSYQYFNDAVITKIKVNSKTNNWNIFITKTKLLPLKVLEELESKYDPNETEFAMTDDSTPYPEKDPSLYDEEE